MRYSLFTVLFSLFTVLSAQSSPFRGIRGGPSKPTADTLYSQHHYAEAAEAYTSLLKANPDNAAAL